MRISTIMLGSMQPQVLATFYQAVFDRVPDMRDEDWSGSNIDEIFFAVGKHSEAKGQNKSPERIMFNLEVEDVAGEFERLKDIDGIRIIKAPNDLGPMVIATLADPDGN